MKWLSDFRLPYDTALRGFGGEYEITRVLGGFVTLAYSVCVNFFAFWNIVVEHRPFNIIEYCAAFPGGAVALIGAAAGAAALKDRNVATAKIIERTGAVPTKSPPSAPVEDMKDA